MRSRIVLTLNSLGMIGIMDAEGCGRFVDLLDHICFARFGPLDIAPSLPYLH